MLNCHKILLLLLFIIIFFTLSFQKCNNNLKSGILFLIPNCSFTNYFFHHDYIIIIFPLTFYLYFNLYYFIFIYIIIFDFYSKIEYVKQVFRIICKYFNPPYIYNLTGIRSSLALADGLPYKLPLFVSLVLVIDSHYYCNADK